MFLLSSITFKKSNGTMTRINYLRKTLPPRGRGIFLSALVSVVSGWLLVSCAGSEAIRSAPSIDAVDGINNKLVWLKANAVSGGEYVIELSADDMIKGGPFSKGGRLYYKDKSNITIRVRGVGENRTILRLFTDNEIFEVGSGVTLILDSNITLKGSADKYTDGPMVEHQRLVTVTSGGTLVMNNGSAIIGNINNKSSGGGVSVAAGGAFYMNGGIISGNKGMAGYRAIDLKVTGEVAGKMAGAALLGAASKSLPSHTMVSKGLDNAADKMANAQIGTRCPTFYGGGVYVSGAYTPLFGKGAEPSGIFVKTGGTITGLESDSLDGNSIYECEFEMLNETRFSFPPKYSVSVDGGHAVYFDGKEPKSINTTIGPEISFEFRDGVYRETRSEPKPQPQEVIAEAPVEEVPTEVVPEEQVAEPAQAAADVPLAAAVTLPSAVSAQPSAQETAEEVVSVQPVLMAQSAEPVQAVAPTPAKNVDLQPLYSTPTVAAYVFGAKDTAFNKAMATRLVVALRNSGHYQVSEDYMEFFDQAVEEQKAKKGSTEFLNVGQIKELGERFGADFVCVTEIVTVWGEYRAFAYLLRVKTAKSVAKGDCDKPLKTLPDLTVAAEEIVGAMLNKGQTPAISVASIAPSAPPPASQAQACEPVSCPPCKECASVEAVEAVSVRRSKTGFMLGYGFSGDANIAQFGFAHVQAITENVTSLVVEAGFRFGEWNTHFDSYYDAIPYYGVNVPVLFKFEKGAVFMEMGAFVDALFVKNEQSTDNASIINAGMAAGAGLSFGKGYTQYFYRFNYGSAYYSHLIGIRQLF